MQSKLITIVGPTASGKTSFAVRLAHVLGGEIIGADSRQIYRGMDIGTGKDISEYQVGETVIPYHLIDIRAAGDKYTLFDYQHDFHAVLQDILSRNRRPILCGGTGLYIESVLKGYHLPDVPINAALRKSLEGKSLQELTQILQSFRSLHNTTDTDTAQRAVRAIEIASYQADQSISETRFPPLESCVLGLMIDRDLRRAKITARLKTRLQEGMIDEVKGLLEAGVAADDLIYYGLEYKFVTLYLTGRISREQMEESLAVAIHQFAKRQMTWFRGMERKGIKIEWIEFNI